ncbi:helix-turn-helix domain-containing protein [Aliihoeflea aestuarii]|jgi:CRP-like cAMP-binding protein|uniref:Crp/Fnr family transcriptional regulator n=1 Tax=Aliihoeflea aestuarii TaxID=453840 RepID=UPI002092AA54|nr:Crp/Fnr family transcriptional regulator [Aliihoeflea aestuarii]MCO6391078.1 helix-turn-helix domain-containing protein [Aliihoeflea aestuarii]
MNALVRKLEHFCSFNKEERAVLDSLSELPLVVAPRHDIIREGDNPTGVNLIVDGYAVRYKALADGRRQILGYFVPGDICDLRVFILKRMDHSIATLTQAEIKTIPEKRVVEVVDRYPRIMRALWWATLVEESITREWLLSMGQRTAVERFAHLFCEIYHRAHAVGLADGPTVRLPLRQSDLAEMTGLSAVHVNRVLQQLRKSGVVKFDGRLLTIVNLEQLEEIALFDPLYLHMGEGRAAKGIQAKSA